MKTVRTIKLATMALIVTATPLVLNSCVSGHAIRTGAVVAPTSLGQVELLLESPKRNYESLGLVESKMPDAFFASEKKITKKVLEDLRRQAATLGADAVILKNSSTTVHNDLIVDIDDDFSGLLDTEVKRMSGIAIRYK